VDVGLLCGSRGERSANAALLRVATARLERAGHAAHPIEFVDSIAPFDPALVDDPPAAVARFRRAVRNCDALLIAAPEYAAGVAGTTKNALDWLVGDATIYRTVIGVASAGTTGGSYAVEQLVRTISWQGGWVVATLGVAAPRTKSDEHGDYTDAATLTGIADWADTVVGAAEGSGGQRLALLSGVVARFGIDPARFGDVE
jgi:chromate reductase, NAD(P)H dehydrogenase (quinone)